MERNFFRRIEVAFPILDPKLKKRVIEEGLKKYLADNMQAWEMHSDGHYERLKPTRNAARSAQMELLNELSGPRGVEEATEKTRKPKRKQKA
jgi:polyphosphate kinase